MRPDLLGIRHVALFSMDLQASERFWVDVMGYTVEWRPDPDNLYLTSGRDNLALHRAATGAKAGEGGALDHIGLAVPRPEDVDAWAEHLLRAGMRLEEAPKQHRDGSRSLYFREPGGVLVQIIHHAPLA
jgi:catechol 2,3-dioxygenase-like lactoylglutathione lyase family enzyme